MAEPFRHLGEDDVYEGSFLRVSSARFLAPDGTEHVRDVVRHPGSIGVVALDGDDVLLVRQYRAAIDMLVLEIPAGKIDDHDDDLESTTRREIREELGVDAGRLDPLGSVLMTPGFCDERLRLFLARDLAPVDRAPDGVEERHMEIVRMPFREALEMVDDGRIVDAKTMIGLRSAAVHLAS